MRVYGCTVPCLPRMLASSAGFHFMVPFRWKPFLVYSHPIRIRIWNASTEIKKYRTCKMQLKCTVISLYFSYAQCIHTFVCFLSLFFYPMFLFNFSVQIRSIHTFHFIRNVCYCLKVTVCSNAPIFQLYYATI